MRQLLEPVEWVLILAASLGLGGGTLLVAADDGSGWLAAAGIVAVAAAATWHGTRIGRLLGRTRAAADYAEDHSEWHAWPKAFMAGGGEIRTIRVDDPRKVLVVTSGRELRVTENKERLRDGDEYSVRISCADESDSEIAAFVKSVLDEPDVNEVLDRTRKMGERHAAEGISDAQRLAMLRTAPSDKMRAAYDDAYQQERSNL